ncbi:ankyrin repeat domain-containing protein [Brenneria rubrifaciens]|uniref:Ankyrin repeat domain-containing protein n=2 Tax=Brenneria rubrifaciens TaxID=55213 RepID=A0A4P8QXH2_9GAMM|nr:ankyrin repeat domain-containing protein [Brenneria rubrifaciens]QCR10320.1 ankyrin repeat domain-containing protein [Brenneria rubrifaciens]
MLCLLATCFSAAGADEKTQDEHALKQTLNTYLWDAAREGNLDIINTFIASKYNLNVADEKGYTAVILAAYHGHDTAVETLLKGGADPCIRDKRGNSALMGAVFKGEVKIARRLIAAECNPDERNNAGQTAAMFASLFQREELLKALKAKGADMQAVDAKGNSVKTLRKGEFVTH